MSILVIAEHDNSNLKTFSLNVISAACKIDSDIHVLVAGHKCENVCKIKYQKFRNVKKVIHIRFSEIYENYLAENFTPIIVKASR